MHRDIKPENIIFEEKSNYKTLKIADFGLSTFQHKYPYIFSKCGTPGFVAPEIANLENKTIPYSSKCDVFSAGVIFHLLLTGDTLFKGNKFEVVLKNNKECDLDFNRPQYELI